MDKETREFLDRKFNAIDDKFAGIDEKFSGMDQKFTGIDEKFEETKRYFGVVAEGLEHKIQLVGKVSRTLMKNWIEKSQPSGRR